MSTCIPNALLPQISAQETLQYLKNAQHSWQRRVTRSLNGMCGEVQVALARRRGDAEREEWTRKWPELSLAVHEHLSIKPVYAPRDFLEILLAIRNPNAARLHCAPLVPPVTVDRSLSSSLNPKDRSRAGANSESLAAASAGAAAAPAGGPVPIDPLAELDRERTTFMSNPQAQRSTPTKSAAKHGSNSNGASAKDTNNALNAAASAAFMHWGLIQIPLPIPSLEQLV